jgi:hypothetical protein
MFFKKKTEKRSFNDVLSALASQKFDVAQGGGGSGTYRVSKYGVAAEIRPNPAANEKIVPPPAPAEIVSRAGWVLNGQIASLVDKGYQKFLKAGKLEIVATADHLRAIHDFQQELDEAAGATMLYNESLGTTSDKYMYDRVAGREVHSH